MDVDMARQESNRTDLVSQVNVLETKKASLTGDLNSIAASADSARSEAAAAEGRLKVAQHALAEAEKALPGAKAQLGDVQGDIVVATNQLDSIKLEVTNLQALHAKYSVDKSDVDRATAEKATLEMAVTDLQGRQAQLAKELELKQGELTAIRDELANLNGRKGVLAQQIAALDEEKTSKDAVQPSPPPEAARIIVQPATP
jgi:chromosome segregation ATPase